MDKAFKSLLEGFAKQGAKVTVIEPQKDEDTLESKVDKLIDIMNKNMPLHIVEKKIPYINENGELVKPESPNGYKFETLVLDMIHLMDNCLSFEIDRKKEFAPIKNRTGVDSLDSARELMKYNNIEF